MHFTFRTSTKNKLTQSQTNAACEEARHSFFKLSLLWSRDSTLFQQLNKIARWPSPVIKIALGDSRTFAPPEAKFGLELRRHCTHDGFYMHQSPFVYSSSKKKTKHPLLFQYKLSYRNETRTNHHGLVSTSVWCFKIFLWVASTWGVST